MSVYTCTYNCYNGLRMGPRQGEGKPDQASGSLRGSGDCPRGWACPDYPRYRIRSGRAVGDTWDGCVRESSPCCLYMARRNHSADLGALGDSPREAAI